MYEQHNCTAKPLTFFMLQYVLVHAKLGLSVDPQISLKRIMKSKGPKAIPCEHKTSQCKKMKGCGSYERAEAHLIHQGAVKPLTGTLLRR
jgi:hypothetical protein